MQKESQKVSIALRIEKEYADKIEKLAFEGNVSQWIRLLIKRELERIEKEK